MSGKIQSILVVLFVIIEVSGLFAQTGRKDKEQHKINTDRLTITISWNVSSAVVEVYGITLKSAIEKREKGKG